MSPNAGTPWYRGVSGFQWLVLALASAGWVFDIYEGQIFNITRRALLTEVAATNDDGLLKYYGDVMLGVFLVGGALGGVLFGVLADRWGRRPVLILTILTYSLFSGLTYFAQTLWQVALLRFLVALGTGGEWSVAAAWVAEVFPMRGRAQAGAIFHATSILGTWLAALAALLVGAEWRYAYVLGVVPALLVVAVRWLVHDREQAPVASAKPSGTSELWRNATWRKHAALGLGLATVGLATFWGVIVAGQDLVVRMLREEGLSLADADKRAQFAYGFVQATGGGVGLLAFGPLASWLGRKGAFFVMQAGALLVVPAACYLPTSYVQLLALLPLYGFFTLGMHAGFAIYFPELFPARLRATGSGLCFNGGRLLAASVLVFSGWLKSVVDLRLAVTQLSLLFLAGIAILTLLPETKDQPLPN